MNKRVMFLSPIAAFLWATVAYVRLSLQRATGVTPFDSNSGSGVESVDLASGNLDTHIPLFSLPQTMSFSLDVSPNSFRSNGTVDYTSATRK